MGLATAIMTKRNSVLISIAQKELTPNLGDKGQAAAV